MLILDRMEGDDDSLQQHVCWYVNRVCVHVCVGEYIYVCVCVCMHACVCVGGGGSVYGWEYVCVCVCVTVSIFQVKEKLKS